jgi:hypothetical protein
MRFETIAQVEWAVAMMIVREALRLGHNITVWDAEINRTEINHATDEAAILEMFWRQDQSLLTIYAAHGAEIGTIWLSIGGRDLTAIIRIMQTKVSDELRAVLMPAASMLEGCDPSRREPYTRGLHFGLTRDRRDAIMMGRRWSAARRYRCETPPPGDDLCSSL